MILSAIILLCLLATSASGAAVKGGAARDEYAVKGGRQLLAPIEQQRRYVEQRELTKTGAREEAPAQVQEQIKEQREEAPQHQAKYETIERASTRYEAKQQVRADEPAKGQKAAPEPSKTADERRDEQAPEQIKQEEVQQREEQVQQQYAVHKLEEAPTKGQKAAPEPTKNEERHEEQSQLVQLTEQREEATKGARKSYEAPKYEAPKYEAPKYEAQKYETQKYETQKYEAEAKSAAKPYAQRAEDEQQLQQQVELGKHDYEQRRFDDQQQRAEEQQYEEQAVKGASKSSGSAEAEPYAFDYSVEGSSRRETGDVHGVVRGQYTLQSSDGSQRIVDYVADRDGFRAQVQTNEFGTESQQPANVALRSSQPSAESISLQLEGRTREYIAPAPVGVKAPPLPPPPPAPAADIKRARPTYEEAPAAKSAEQQTEIRAAPAKSAAEPIRSAEARTAKALLIEPKVGVIQARGAEFESATAHRPVVHLHPAAGPAPIVRSVPTVVRHSARDRLASPVRNHHHHYHHLAPPAAVPISGDVTRSQLRHDRYPPTSYRREQPPPGARVSFYANHYDEEPAVGFEHAPESS